MKGWSIFLPFPSFKVDVLSFAYDNAQNISKGGEATGLIADSHVGSLAIAFWTKNCRWRIDSQQVLCRVTCISCISRICIGPRAGHATKANPWIKPPSETWPQILDSLDAEIPNSTNNEGHLFACVCVCVWHWFVESGAVISTFQEDLAEYLLPQAPRLKLLIVFSIGVFRDHRSAKSYPH
jgi:hypothetical protein